MSGGSLRLRFVDEGDGSGRLVAHAEANGFSGEGGAYFATRALETFAVSLGAFPLIGRPSIAGGFWSKTSPGQLEQEHLALAFYAVNARGHIGVHVKLANELWPPARAQSQHVVSLEMITLYEPLGCFSRAFLELLKGKVEEAVLEGEL